MKNKAEPSKVERIEKLLKAGHPPDTIAYDIGCSKQYVYNVRSKMSRVKAAPATTLKRRAEIREAVMKVNSKGSKKEVITAKPKKEVIHCITKKGELCTVTINRSPTQGDLQKFLDELKRAL